MCVKSDVTINLKTYLNSKLRRIRFINWEISIRKRNTKNSYDLEKKEN